MFHFYSFVIGGFITLAMLSLTIFFFKIKYKEFFYFSLFCICFAVLELTRGILPFSEIIFYKKYLYLVFINIIVGTSIFYPISLKIITNKKITRFSKTFYIIESAILFFYFIFNYDNMRALYFILLSLFTVYFFFILFYDFVKKKNYYFSPDNLIIISYCLLLVLFLICSILLIFNMLTSPKILYTSYYIFSILNALALGLKIYEEHIELSTKKQMEKLQKSKIQAIINITHDTRTSLSNMINAFEVIVQETKKISSQIFQNARSVINREIHKLYRYIENITDAQKTDDGTIIYSADTVYCLSAVIQDEIRNFYFSAKKKNLKFEAEIEKNIFIKADRNLLFKIISNLFGNAVKYTEKGIITVSLQAADNKINFTVRDTGRGISQEKISRIYKRYELAGEKKRKKEGLGFGLISVMDAVKALQGQLVISSREGKGSAFTVTLPGYWKKHTDTVKNDYILSHPEIFEEPIVPKVENRPGRMFLFVLDDDERILSDLIYELNSKGDYNLYIAQSVKEAFRMIDEIEAYNKEFPRIIISDIMMQGLDGFDFVEKLKMYKRFRSIPVIFLTAKVDRKSRENGLKMGISYITKPFNASHLKLQINSIINTLYYTSQERTTLYGYQSYIDNKCDLFKLSDKQKHIVKLLLSGYRNKDIEKELNIAKTTVSTYLDKIYEKMQIPASQRQIKTIFQIFNDHIL